jgi:pimeloyl-ACP methyl ester carboxylesterase
MAEGAELDKRKHAVLILHGIRDVAPWSTAVRKAFQGTDTEVTPIGMAFVDLMAFVLPWSRSKRIEWIRSQIASYSAQEYRVSIIAHSFGTYIVGKILEKYPEIKLHRLVLCGAILPRQFEWQKIFGRNILSSHVINDCGTNDWWPIVASSFIWGCDASGTFGFTQHGVTDRYHVFGHSGALNEEFAAKYWVPWLRNGEYVHSELDAKRPNPSWAQQTLHYFWKILLIVLVFFVGWRYGPSVLAYAKTHINPTVPDTALPGRIDPPLQSWTKLQEQIKPGDDNTSKIRIRLNRWRMYLAKGAQPWLFRDEPSNTMMAWTEVVVSQRNADSVSYTCHINPRYRIVEMYAFLVSDSDGDTYAPVFRQQKPTIDASTCLLDLDRPRAAENLLLFVLVERSGEETIDSNPSSWGFYLQRR